MAKRLVALFFLLVVGSVAMLFAADELSYTFSYQLCGSASGRALIFVPFRVYYEAGAEVKLVATPTHRDTWRFAFAGLTRPGVILRTLGFSGKQLGVLTAADDFESGRRFGQERVAEWTAATPDFSRYVGAVYYYPHRLLSQNRSALNFERDRQGVHRNVSCNMELLYQYAPKPLELYIQIYPMMAELLGAFNHAPLPPAAECPGGQLPAEWNSPPLDFSSVLNGLAMRMEKIVGDLITLRQPAAFRIRYRIVEQTPEVLEVKGESRVSVTVWKGFAIRECTRRLRLRPADGLVLLDEMTFAVRNDKGQGGTGHMLLKLVSPEPASR